VCSCTRLSTNPFLEKDQLSPVLGNQTTKRVSLFEKGVSPDGEKKKDLSRMGRAYPHLTAYWTLDQNLSFLRGCS